MSLKDTPQYKEIMEAYEAVKEMSLPEHLQKVAFQHLLNGKGTSSIKPTTNSHSFSIDPSTSDSSTLPLRSFIGEVKPKGAVAEIPCLIYWVKTNEGKNTIDEKGIIELYRRAGLRPPKKVSQSLRDLCSKKYNRLEVAAGQSGYVSLSRTGEDFVLHDIIEKKI